MVRTLLSDHTRLAAGAIVGAVTAALFVEGLIGGPPEASPRDRSAVSEGAASAPDPLPAVVDNPPSLTTTTVPPTSTTTTPTTTTTTTTSKRPSPTTTTTTTVPPATTTTTVRPTTTTTTRTCRILC